MTYYLSIDYGGTNTKALIFDKLGHQIAVSSFETLKNEAQSGHRQVNLVKTWNAITSAIREVIQISKLSPEQISAVACIGHGKGLYLLDNKLEPLEQGILSTDNRAKDLAQYFESKLDNIWELTRQHIFPSQSPVILRWLKDYQPETYKSIGVVLSAKDFIRYKLTGKVQQEYGDASGNHWINFQTGTYDPAILDFFGIREIENSLPELIDSADLVPGGISSQAAKETGLVEGTPVVGGLFDIDACALGSGVLESDTFSVISGTWNINTYPSLKPAKQDSGLMTSYFPDRRYLLEASSPTSAGNLDFMLKMLMHQEIDNAKSSGGSIYDNLEEFLTHTDATHHGLIFFPFLYGSNTSQDASACFFGLTTKSTKSQMIRAVYEGIAFAHKQHITDLIKSRGGVPKIIRFSGGATNSPAWMQMFSDILNLPIETVEGTELGGLGGAILAHHALDKISLKEAVQDMVRVKAIYKPQLSEVKGYEKKYHAYQKLLETLDPIWSELGHLNK
ncbi:TPA: carbohydrate kinase [Streptococcus agalactiae]|uniref:FGGY-family carbohydrate kinase n=1 Tax=Streptococcus agalactiae TaxID=1311 RepID=UPI000810A619|nr:FGGY-family carbohydrate kinase [Streptococcus agalactiae]OCL55567.1 carbohydrate kinase [Streptococcus agalactiae]HEO0387242.1 carbohydrate kinase [Streptococcus agalactiae]HEO2023911.1 carbohydrate kinase [Streptococcus agalactiae]